MSILKNKLPLKVENLSMSFSKPLFTGISLELQKGEFVTLMGENGTGKTVFLECLMGVRSPSTGNILFWQQQHRGKARGDINRKTGWVCSQGENFPPLMKIGRLLKWTSTIYPSWDESLCQRLLQNFQLDPEKRLSNLSMGESSKVRLIKALAFKPELLILDELTANLSEPSKDAVLSILLELFHDQNMSVLYISHSTEEAIKLSDRVLDFTSQGLEARS